MSVILSQEDIDEFVNIFEAGCFTKDMFIVLVASHNLLRNIVGSYMLDVEENRLIGGHKDES